MPPVISNMKCFLSRSFVDFGYQLLCVISGLYVKWRYYRPHNLTSYFRHEFYSIFRREVKRSIFGSIGWRNAKPEFRNNWLIWPELGRRTDNIWFNKATILPYERSWDQKPKSLCLLDYCFTWDGPPLCSSGQSTWLQIRRPWFDSRHYQKKK
jgi:hypothetical protein